MTAGSGGVRLWAISDIHVDSPDNMKWFMQMLKNLDAEQTARDALILAGDVSDRSETLRQTLAACKQRFARVFFCAGNHDLWPDPGSRGAKVGTMQKLRDILAMCTELGVESAPADFGDDSASVLVVPLQSWHHPSWDTEPDITEWDGLFTVEEVFMDYHKTSWPPGVQIADGTAAAKVDAVNDELFDMEALLSRRAGGLAVVSFSHMLPRVELNPEKRYLFHPALAKASGSTPLRKRVERLKPDVHVFGHTHFGFDLELDGVRYVQAPLSYPTERETRGGSVALGEFLTTAPKPFLVWSSAEGWAQGLVEHGLSTP